MICCNCGEQNNHPLPERWPIDRRISKDCHSLLGGRMIEIEPVAMQRDTLGESVPRSVKLVSEDGTAHGCQLAAYLMLAARDQSQLKKRLSFDTSHHAVL